MLPWKANTSKKTISVVDPLVALMQREVQTSSNLGAQEVNPAGASLHDRCVHREDTAYTPHLSLPEECRSNLLCLTLAQKSPGLVELGPDNSPVTGELCEELHRGVATRIAVERKTFRAEAVRVVYIYSLTSPEEC